MERKLDDCNRTNPGLDVSYHGASYIDGSFRDSITQYPTLKPRPVATRSRRVRISGGCRYPNPHTPGLAMGSLGQNYDRKRDKKRWIPLNLGTN